MITSDRAPPLGRVTSSAAASLPGRILDGVRGPELTFLGHSTVRIELAGRTRLTDGPATRAMGHLLEAGGHSVYAAGDTDLFDGMADLGERGLGVALLPVWGWGPTLGPGHLDPLRAAQAVALLRPRVAVPVHWGTLALAASRHLPSPARSRMARRLVDPPREFAAAVASLGL